MARSSNLDIPLRIIDRHNEIIKKATSKQKAERVSRSIFEGLRQGFYARTDARARSNRLAYHHLYEWGATGDPGQRLFKISSVNRGTAAFQMSYDFSQSKVPVPGGTHLFAEKARVMEEGQPVTIAPISSDFLAFQVDDEMVFTNKPVTVDNPGGDAVAGTLRSDFMFYFRPSSLVNNPILNSIVDAEVKKTLRELDGK